MPWDLAVVLGLLVICIVLFIIDWPRMDVVALSAMVALPVLGIISVQEAFAGFSDPNVVLIAALFVIGEGITRTGIALQVGQWLALKAGRSEARLVVLLMLSVGLLGSVMSSTGIVAIFIPVVLNVTSRLNIHPGRMMMPLSVAGLISGMMTLVATPPNMIVDSALESEGHPGFNFFSFTPMGLSILVLSVGYMLVARHWLTAKNTTTGTNSRRRTLKSFIEEYKLQDRAFRLQVPYSSELIGRTLGELDLRQRNGVNLIGIERHGRGRNYLLNPIAQTEIRPGDVLLADLVHPENDLEKFVDELGLVVLSIEGSYFSQQSKNVGMAEVAVVPESGLIGRTILDEKFRTVYGLSVIGLRRGGDAFAGAIADEKLRPGDILLVIGPWKQIHNLRTQKRNFLVLSLPAESDDIAPAISQAPWALMSLAVMIMLMVSGIVPNAIAALIACLMLGLFRCVDVETAYKSIRWQSVFLIVGMMPFAIALEKTHGIELAVEFLMNTLDGAGIHVLIAVLFVLTTGFSLVISNTATAILMAPIAMSIAKQLDVSPYPFVMTVAIAASAAFMTPVASPVNTLVMGPGEYKFGDYLKIGTPFTILVLIACVILIPWWYG
ncbi:SLC13 family permease [Blastopirellula marina]|uniref:SLC13 family permease n=1 Tax=Blastopirellula marina TaxID=124 RepID=A0A2S8F1B0_9BACT|nr:MULTISPECIES: SLC13 family permease [Pirellulaceae]PQO25962.1 SLC13 family permease [Blastopirellula marina]RCS44320.1 SLC13 family permease [Bremerella cremea]